MYTYTYTYTYIYIYIFVYVVLPRRQPVGGKRQLRAAVHEQVLEEHLATVIHIYIYMYVYIYIYICSIGQCIAVAYL